MLISNVWALEAVIMRKKLRRWSHIICFKKFYLQTELKEKKVLLFSLSIFFSVIHCYLMCISICVLFCFFNRFLWIPKLKSQCQSHQDAWTSAANYRTLKRNSAWPSWLHLWKTYNVLWNQYQQKSPGSEPAGCWPRNMHDSV